MLPSTLDLGSRVPASRLQRHVRLPWRSRTVRNCSVRSGPTVTVSAPNEVARVAPPANEVQPRPSAVERGAARLAAVALDRVAAACDRDDDAGGRTAHERRDGLA